MAGPRRHSSTVLAVVAVVLVAAVLSFGTYVLTRGGGLSSEEGTAGTASPRQRASAATAVGPVPITVPFATATLPTTAAPLATSVVSSAPPSTMCSTAGLSSTSRPLCGDDDEEPCSGLVRAVPCGAAPTATTVLPAQATTATTDQAVQAAMALLELAAADSTFVDANLTGTYVVQVNAKYLDRVDELDGRYYDAQAIIDLYHALDSRHGGVVIVVADDYSTNSYPGLFQVLLRQGFSSKGAGQAWCDGMGLTIDDCFPRGTPIGRR